jgi:phosphatidylinositol glycan class M
VYALLVQGRLLASVAAWVATMGHWLFWAYQLEFGGKPLFLAVWVASLVFLAAHVWVIFELIRSKSGAVKKLKGQ